MIEIATGTSAVVVADGLARRRQDGAAGARRPQGLGMKPIV
ncbi:MAG: hypothetical protein ABI281_05665 [Caldimonas sp.]